MEKIKFFNNKSYKKTKKKNIKKKKKKNDSFTRQFDLMKFSENIPTAVNVHSTDLQRDVDFKYNYSNFASEDMHYSVINNFPNNMAPHTSQRDLQVDDGSYQSRKCQIFTGTNKLKKNKTAVGPFFKPKKNQSVSIKCPIVTENIKSRYRPSSKKNFGNLPFNNKIKVLPGLNGKVQNKNTIYRVLPKTTNELRSKTNPKISYKNIVNKAIKKGGLRGTNPNITKYKKISYKVQKSTDLVGNSSKNKGPKQSGKVQLSNGNRSTNNNYSSNIHNSDRGDGPNKDKSRWGQSYKITYNNDNSRNISNIKNKFTMSNKKAYKNYENERSSTNYNGPGQIIDRNQGNYTINPNDIPITTLRELMIHNNNILGLTDNNKTYVFSKDNVLPVTQRETYCNNNQNNLSVQIKSTYSKNNDIAKPTIKQTTQFNKNNGNILGNQYISTTRIKNDKAKQTIKETTLKLNYGNIKSNNKTYIKNNDKAKKTIKQTTLLSNYIGNIKDFVASYILGTQKPKKTVKQTTLYNTPAMNLNDHDKSIYIKMLDDKAKQTIKQTTLYNTPAMNLNDYDKSLYIKMLGDKAKTTIKETTLLKNYTGALENKIKDPTNRTAAYNMETNDKKEILTYNRVPGSKYDGTYVIDKNSYQLKNPILVSRNNMGHHVLDDNCSGISQTFTREKDKLKLNESNYRINYDFINTLDNNELVNDLYHQNL